MLYILLNIFFICLEYFVLRSFYSSDIVHKDSSIIYGVYGIILVLGLYKSMALLLFSLHFFDIRDSYNFHIKKDRNFLLLFILSLLFIPSLFMFRQLISADLNLLLVSVQIFFGQLIFISGTLWLIRELYYVNGNDSVGEFSIYFLLTIGLIGVNIPQILKLLLIVIEVVFLLCVLLYLIWNGLTRKIRKNTRLNFGSVFQFESYHKKNKIWRGVFTLPNILNREQIDTRCDFFQNCSFLIDENIENLSAIDFFLLLNQNYYSIVTVAIYEKFIMKNEQNCKGVVIVRVLENEVVKEIPKIPSEFKEVVNDFYWRRLKFN